MNPSGSSRTTSPDDDLPDQLEAIRLRLEQLERTLSVVARDALDASVGGPCPSCNRCLLLVDGHTLECRTCGFQRSL